MMKTLSAKQSALIIAILTCVPGAALAAPDNASGGLPQMNPDSFSSQIFWLFVFFILLYIILSTVALPRIASVLEKRRNKVSNDLEDAKTLREEAEKVKDAYEQSLSSARDDVKLLMTSVNERIAEENQKAHGLLTEDLMQKTEQAEKELHQSKEKALGDLQEAATSIALELANKLGDIAVNDNEAADAVKAAQKAHSKTVKG